ncbi:hypothetical protein PINS_up009324 [Pythium insidiosum]|nr:hypothetical protein PINS_up009324 [Pythium insidiosum]
MEFSKQPPPYQYEQVASTLASASGVVIRQKTQSIEVFAQVMDINYEAQNKYRVHLLPLDKRVKSDPEDSRGWEPTRDELKSLPPFLFVQEESSLFMRMMCANLRPLRLHISVENSTGDVFLVDRPFQCGGACCCPLEMHVDAVAGGNLRRIGRVRENFSPYLCKCWSIGCLATGYTDMERALPGGDYEKAYTLRANLACCGRVDNCCAPSICKNDAVYDILDPKGEIVAHLQVTYAGGDCLEACYRADNHYNNYILEFPPHASVEDRMLLLTALFQIEYQFFERKTKNG